jgi:hypothetical protein
MSFKKNTTRFILIGLAFVICGVVVYYTLPKVLSNNIEYKSDQNIPVTNNTSKEILKDTTSSPKAESLINNITSDSLIPVTHIKTPEHVRALYVWLGSGFR